jgi:hypothetical protein
MSILHEEILSQQSAKNSHTNSHRWESLRKSTLHQEICTEVYARTSLADTQVRNSVNIYSTAGGFRMPMNSWRTFEFTTIKRFVFFNIAANSSQWDWRSWPAHELSLAGKHVPVNSAAKYTHMTIVLSMRIELTQVKERSPRVSRRLSWETQLTENFIAVNPILRFLWRTACWEDVVSSIMIEAGGVCVTIRMNMLRWLKSNYHLPVFGLVIGPNNWRKNFALSTCKTVTGSWLDLGATPFSFCRSLGEIFRSLFRRVWLFDTIISAQVIPRWR